MLRSPHNRYERIYLYHLDVTVGASFPVSDPDAIGYWDEPGGSFLFFHAPRDTVVKKLASSLGGTVAYQADMDYADWENGGAVTRFNIGGLTVAPVWQPAGADIVLDPSVVFGNGFHPSTRLCLEALATLAKKGAFPSRVLDLGCGSGLLSLAALRFGARHVKAVDENTLACRVALQNATRNDLAQKVEVVHADVQAVLDDAAHYDLVLANLPGAVLTSLFERPVFWQGSHYIVSGFLHQSAAALKAVVPASVRIVAEEIQGPWGMLMLVKTNMPL